MSHRWIISGICLGAAIGALAMVTSSRASSNDVPPAPPAEPAPNPHWKSDGCVRCHGEGEPTAIDAARVTQLCIRCHDGIRASKEVHPVGRTFDGDKVVLPEGWPAPEGKLGCLTCHDVLMGCGHDKVRPETNPSFLREFTGPGVLEHCARCHVAAAKTKGQRYSPHKMLDDSGQPVAEACAFCHTPELTVNAAVERLDRKGQPALRTDGISLCVGCHRTHKDYFSPGHIGLMVGEEFRNHMAQRQPPASGKVRETLATQPALTGQARLPLEDGRRIVCATCHNPHQQGVFPATSVLGAGAMINPGAPRGDLPPTTDTHKRLQRRGLGPNVCLGCHEK